MKTQKPNLPRPDEDAIIINRMDRMVNSYDKYMKRVTLGRENTLRRMTVDLARINPGDSVLEVGCGTGTLTIAAKEKAGPAGSVYGIDMIAGMIEKSREKAKNANLDITFRPGSIDNLSFPDNHFDVVMCSFMIFHMSEKVRNNGIGEIYRVLKPGGNLLILDISLPSGTLSRLLVKILLGFMLRHDLVELKPVMESSGFSQIENSTAEFRVFGLPLISYVRAIK
jgi:ubiquinone/menaquinone biosynthesis C-methylase UbiE